MASLVEGSGVRRPTPGRAQSGGGLVQRSVLFERLSAVGSGGVALVCAPAGSGKSVLVRSWVDDGGLDERTGWVLVERGERDGQRFWLSVIDALAGVAASVERVAPAPSFQGEAVVDRLLADLAAVERPVVLVVDDLHELRSADALGWLERLLERRPPQLIVVLSTREDPRLGLHRLRLTGELAEIRGPDLSFSLAETRELLRAARIRLSDEGLALLYERTEGWAAGLRLAAISLAHHPNPERFVQEFSGSERTVAGYLVAEVLDRHPAEVRELLLRTSILERVSGSLADYLTGNSGSERILQQLEDQNAFVSSLDVGRTWFRYHHLFADLLQLELRRVAPASVRSLHRAAVQWYEQNGYPVDAVRHAQAAHDWTRASHLLADNYFELVLDGRLGTVTRPPARVPARSSAADAELALVFAAVRVLEGEREKSWASVGRAQQLADTVPAERQARFDAQLATIRIVVARWRGDLGTVLEASQSLHATLAAQPPGDGTLSDELRIISLQNLGIAELWSSRVDDARRHLEQALELARHIVKPWLEIASLGHLAIAGPLTGLPISDGLEHSQEALRIAETHIWDEDPVIVTPLATGAIALLLMGRFDEAEASLERAQHVLQPGGEPGTELLVHYAQGLLRLAQRRLEDALRSFEAAERMQTIFAGEHALTIALRSRVLQTQLAMGDTAGVHAAFSDLSEDVLQHAGMRITAAAIHLSEDDPQQAIETLAAVTAQQAHTLHAKWAATEALALDAVACDRLGDRRAAEASLECALELAEPEGIILPFTLHPVQELLERHPGHRTAHGTLVKTIRAALAGASAPARTKAAPLLEELSEAELRIVRYLPSNLKAPEMAAELCVSANTVRTHIRHIYAKLDAHNRNEAVARARELGLLSR